MKITIELPDTGLEEDILRKGEWEDDSLFGRSIRNALMHFTKESLEQASVLDKIRAEIGEVYEELDGYDLQSLGTFASRIDEIIDKYKTKNLDGSEFNKVDCESTRLERSNKD